MARPVSVARLVVLAIVLVAFVAGPVEGASIDSVRASGLAYLAEQARDPGPFAAYWVEAAHANGLDPAAWPAGSPLAAQVDVPPENASFIHLLRPLHALALAQDDRMPGLRARVLAGFDGTQFGEPDALNDDAYAILALRAAGISAQDARLQQASRGLLEHRNPDGGWGWAVGVRSGVDMTGMILLALQETNRLQAFHLDEVQPFLSLARSGPGYNEHVGGSGNCESTVWALRIQAMASRPMDENAWQFLLSLQQDDGGFAHAKGGGSDVFCSSAMITLLGDVEGGRIPGPASKGIPGLAVGLALAGVLLATAARRRF